MHSPNTSLSRFSSQAFQGEDELKNSIRSSGQSLLSHELSPSSQESSFMTKSTEIEIGGKLFKGDTKNEEVPISSTQFHFSIYKWGGIGVPLLMPLRGGKSSTLKGSNNHLGRSLSSKGRIESDNQVSELCTANERDNDYCFLNDNDVPFEMGGEEQNKTDAKNSVGSCHVVEEAVLGERESNSFTAENFLGNTTLSNERVDIKTYSLPEVGVSIGNEKKNSIVKEEVNKPELKSLRSMLHNEVGGQGDEEIARKAEGKENMDKMTRASLSNVGATSVKKQESTKVNAKRAEVNKDTVMSPSPENLVRSRVRGKVKEFVKIFNQEAPPKTKMNVFTQSQSSRWKDIGSNGDDSEVSVITTELDDRTPMSNVSKKPDASFPLVGDIAKSNKQPSVRSTVIHTSSDNCSDQMDVSPFPESLPSGSEVNPENIDDHFQIKELTVDEDQLAQIEEDSEAIRASDSKIRNWSNGKKGNIRSLLSTLQYVLWAQSGWKPVALVDIIEANAVKRAYQKALLCLHPDKLQQKGAASHKKYTAEKVFDILQEAWDHFNSLGSI